MDEKFADLNENVGDIETEKYYSRVMVKKAKEGHWVKFGEDLEEAGQQRNKVFWTKAYDCVPRSKLWSVLSEYGINGFLLRAIKSLYANSKSAVRVDGDLSDWFEVRNGLRQGWGNIISALAYADDLVLFGSSEQELQDSVGDLRAACTDFGMTISSSKTQVMHVGKTRKTVQCELNGNLLEQVSQFKYLGCIFSEDGKLDKEFEHHFMQC
ncbi:uncharacterized protein LOC116351002 [Contarinia nasturtii]|uniref:uncharacterized protein LOC116351002 n=1 Tax=Contarinia nasturtii TaxID=265458 RepID=UPI0012D3F903|nr:uncharacterized protein LOC116351002 [Contarinia nasturtii]